MGVFGAFFGRRGVVGFSGALFGVSSGVVGFIVAMFLRAAREKVRPARPDGGCEREKVCPAHEKWPKIGVFWRAGRSFSRKCRWRPAAGRVFSRTGSRGPGCWALLLAVLTLRCAATPYWWHGGQAAQSATYWVNVRMKGPGRPPIGLTCAWMLACPGDMSCVAGPQSPVSGAGRLASLRTSRDATEAGPRRIPPLVACGARRTVSARNSAPEPQLRNNGRGVSANAQFFHQPLTVSTAWVPRSDSAEWALTRPEDRRAAWKREATFSQFTRFHQALT